MNRQILILLLGIAATMPSIASAILPAPTGVTASTDSCWGIEVIWDALAGADSYAVWTSADTVYTSGIAYRDSSVLSGASRTYNVAGIDLTGFGLSATVGGTRASEPPPPALLAASDAVCGTVQLVWPAVAEADSYFVFRDGVAFDSVAAPTTFVEDLAASPGTYTYSVIAQNQCGESTPAFDDGTRPADPPPVPSDLTATDNLCNGVFLQWTDVLGEEKYFIYRDGAPIDTLPAGAISYLDGEAPPAANVTYTIAAFNECEPTPTQSGGSIGYREAAPDPVSGLTATDNNCAGVTLSWTDSDRETGYVVRRDGLFIDSLAADLVAYFDGGASPGVSHDYEVGPYNDCSATPSYGTPVTGLLPPPTPAAPVTVTASDTSCTMIRLDWAASANATEYRVYREGQLLATLAAITVYQDTVGTGSYEYGIAAGNPCGWSDSTVTSGSVLPGAPAPPATVTASDDSCGVIQIDWSASADADSYLVKRDLVVIARVAAPASSYRDLLAGPGTYIYGVSAFNECGASIGTADSGTRLPDTPAAPASVVASDDSCGVIRVDWNASAQADSYLVTRNAVIVGRVASPEVSFRDLGASPGTYTYGVSAFNGCGASLETSDFGTRPPDAPSTPTGVTASDDRCGTVLVTWNSTAGVEQYELFQGATSIATVTDTFFLHSTSPGTFSYSVTAMNSCGVSAPAADNGTSLPGAPVAPAIVVASDDSCGVVRVEWSGVAEADSYLVKRDTVVIARLIAPTLFFRDLSASPGSYTYRVSATNECGASPEGIDTGTRPPDAPPAPTIVTASDDSCGVVRIDWSAVADADSYHVSRDGIVVARLAVPTVSFRDLTATPGTYTYEVVAANVCGVSPGKSDSGTRPHGEPASPTTVTASDNLCGEIELVWSAVAEADSYFITRGGLPIARLAAPTTTYRDTLAAPGSYLYVVRASNICGTSTGSGDFGTRPADPPPAPASVDATDDLCDAVLVTWGTSSGALTYIVRRDADQIAVTTDTFYVDSIAPGGYTYSVSAANTCGQSTFIDDGGTVPPGEPPAPLTIVASDDSCGVIRVDWSAVAEADSYVVSRNSAELARVPAPDTTYRDLTAAPGTSVYGVIAINSCGQSAEVSDAGTLPASLPPAPATVVASDDSCDAVYITWTAAADADSYLVTRDGFEIARLGALTLSHVDGAAIPGDHTYGVSSINQCGASGETTDQGTQPPDPPGPVAGVVAGDDSCGVIEIVWTASADADSYVVSRDGFDVARLAAPTLIYRDLASGPGTFLYGVRALNLCGETSPATDTGTRLADAPPQVTGVTATTDSCNWVRLSWNDSDGETRYRIERNGTLLDSTEFDDTVYVDTDVLPGESHQYRVWGLNSCSTSPLWSDFALGRRPAVPDSVSNLTASTGLCGVIELSWAVDIWTDSVQITRSALGDLTTITTLPAAQLTFSDMASGPGDFEYSLVAFNSCYASLVATAQGSRLPDPPPAPSTVSASVDQCDRISLSWDDVDDEDGYVLYKDGDSLTSTTSDELLYVDFDVLPGATHLYKVIAFNSCGVSPESPVATGFRLTSPDTVSGIFASNDDCDGTLLTWLDVEFETGYVIRRILSGNVFHDSVAADETSYLDTTLGYGETADYQVGALNSCSGGPVFGASVQGSRPPGPPVPPANVIASDDICHVVNITWDQSQNATSYVIRRDGVFIGEVSSEPYLFTDQAAPSGTHTYSVTAKNSCGSSLSTTDDGTRKAGPGQPQGVTATNDLCEGVRINWEEAPGAETYNVKRDGTPIATGLPFSVFSFLDDLVGDDALHSYSVEAVNSCDVVAGTPVLGRRVSGAPSSPTNVTASNDLCDRVDLSWSFSGSTANLTGFQISRRDFGSGAAFDSIGFAPIGQTIHSDSPAPGDYEYLVSTVNQCGLSGETAGSRAMGTSVGVPAAPDFLSESDSAVCQGVSFTLVWSSIPGVTGYVVREGATEISTGDTAFSFVRTSPGNYSFTVAGEGVCGEGPISASTIVQVHSSPASPSKVAATQDECGVIRVSWENGPGSSAWIRPSAEEEVQYLGSATEYVDSLPGGGSRNYFVGSYNLCDTASSATDVSGFAYPLSLPAPESVTATDDRCDSVVVTWQFGGDLVGVEVFRVLRYDGAVSTSVGIVSRDDEYRVVDYPPDVQSRRYVVHAENSCAVSAAAEDLGAARRRPGIPLWTSSISSACVGRTFTLQWQPVDHATSYRVYRNAGLIADVTQRELPLTLFDTGVNDFQVRAVNECGLGDIGEILTVDITDMPTNPMHVYLDSTNCDSVVITWRSQLDSVRVTRSDVVDPVYVGPGNGFAVDRPNRSATYRVRSFNRCGESGGVTVRLGSPLLRPPAPVAVSATNSLCDSVVITWTMPQSDILVSNLAVTRTQGDSTELIADRLDVATRRFVDHTGVGIYEYEVISLNSCGVSIGGETSRDVGEVLPPMGAVSILGTSDQAGCAGATANLVWEAIPSALFYLVWEQGGTVPVDVVEGSRTGTEVPLGAPGVRSFQVQAMGTCGEGVRGDPWPVVVSDEPSTPSGGAASTTLCSRVQVTWSPELQGATGVRIYRDGSAIGFAPSPDTMFLDSTASPGFNYEYSLAAESDCGNSPISAVFIGAAVTGLDAPAVNGPPAGASSLPIPVAFSWNEIGGAKGYRLEISQQSGGAVLDTIVPPTSSMNVSSLALGGEYLWRVSTLGDCGSGTPTGWRSFSTVASAPQVLTSEPANFSTDVVLDAILRVTFNLPLDSTSLDEARLFRGETEIAGTRYLDGNGSVLVFVPNDSLAANSTFTLLLSDLRDVFGQDVGNIAPLTFTTVPGAKPFGDIDDDFQRTPADILYAKSIIIGEVPEGTYEEALIDLNGDGRFDIADLVTLGRLIVDEGVILQRTGEAQKVDITATLSPGMPGRYELHFQVDLPEVPECGFVEVEIPGANVVSVQGPGSDGAQNWTAIDGSRIRVLATEQSVEFVAEVELSRTVDVIRIGAVVTAGRSGEIRRYTGKRGSTVPIVRSDVVILSPNRPNPFNPTTTIRFFMPTEGDAKLTVFDLTGRAVAVLVDGRSPMGWNRVSWDGNTIEGSPVASGIYFARLEAAGSVSETIRMVLVR